MVVGTFLPWLRSGRTTRNSYASDGVARRLLDVSGGLDTLLRGWPFVSLACALGVALLLLGIDRIGAAVAALAAICGGGVSVGVLLSGDRALIRPDPMGPAVTLAGAVVTLVAVLVFVAPFDRSSRRAL